VVGGREKHFLREAVRPLLPEWVCGREKSPFQVPAWSATGNGPFMQYAFDVINGPGLRDCGVFDPGAITHLLNRWPHLSNKAREKLYGALMAILSFCALQRRFGLTLH
jgi:hypothetical protein